MFPSRLTYPLILVGTLLTLIYLSGSWVSHSYVARGGLLCLTIVLSNFILKLADNFLPRKLVSGLKDRAVFVTGCDTGFGHRFARRMDALGVTVYAGCLFSDGPGAQDLKSSASDNLQIVQLDVTRDDQITAAVKFVTATIGEKQLLAVMNNAGVGCSSAAELCSNELYDRMFQVNTMGPVKVTKAFLPLLRKCKASRVVITASLVGRLALQYCSAYCMSKFAVVAFAETLRLEMAKWGITVHTIEPTLFETPLADKTHLAACIQACWAKTSQDVRDEYGEEYLKSMQKEAIGYIWWARPLTEIDDVVDDMIDATVGATPEDRYMPGIHSKLHHCLAEYIPHQLFINVSLYISNLVLRYKA